MDKIFSRQRIDAVFHSASYGMSGREQVSKHSIIEGLRAKRAYIAFLADFHFLQD